MFNPEMLRNLVIENREIASRLTMSDLGCTADEYKSLTDLYQSALDALSEYAGLDYQHADSKTAENVAFDAVKRILSMYKTEDSKIIIDSASLRTMRDVAIAPKRFYSAEYRKANKAMREMSAQLNSRIDDINAFDGIPARLADESIPAWCDRIVESGVDTMRDSVNMCDMLRNAHATYVSKCAIVENIKKAGKWTWRQPCAVSVAVFADMVENYVADCLIDGFNLKTSSAIREDRKAERAERKANTAK